MPGWSAIGVDRSFARCTVAEKDASDLKPREFDFSLDNLWPPGIGPWVIINGEDESAGLSADLTGAIRADLSSWADFNPDVDALRVKYDICRRGSDGFIHFTRNAHTAPPSVMMEKTRARVAL